MRKQIGNLTLKVNKYTLEQFQQSEYPSYEDYIEGSKTVGDNGLHQYDILIRYSSQIVIYNQEELQLVWYALCSGTFQADKPKAAKNLADKLLPYVKEYCPAILNNWPYPSFE
jgi:hypothetical protein